MKMTKTFYSSIAALLLMLGANAANAGLLTVEVNTLALGASAGNWTLTGPTTASEDWLHVLVQFQDWHVDLSPGDYAFAISGGGVGFGAVQWRLSLDGSEFYSNSEGIFLVTQFQDRTEFTVAAVPEPSALALIGVGLLALGFARRKLA